VLAFSDFFLQALSVFVSAPLSAETFNAVVVPDEAKLSATSFTTLHVLPPLVGAESSGNV
jgi:hypothetical protein